MPTKLKGLRIKSVALVDEGANPDAHIRLAKVKDEPTQPTEAERGIVKRVISSIAKAFGLSEVEKAAYTFKESQEVRNYEDVICKEINPMQWAFMDSVRSILFDTELDDPTKETMLKRSVTEYSDAFSKAAPMWAKAAYSETVVAKSAENIEALTRTRDYLSELIAQNGSDDVPPAQPPEQAEPIPPEQPEVEGITPPVEEGEIEMELNIANMTAEDRAAYEELSKKYGTTPAAPAAPVETPIPAAAPVAEPPVAPTAEPATDDVYKGLHPTVKAELETLRKFREEQENAQYLSIAKKYTIIGKKPEELAPILKSLHNSSKEAYDSMIATMDASVELIEKSRMFGEIGKRGNGQNGDAWGKIEAAAQEIVKSKPSLSYSQAIDEACNQHPELLAEYEKSRQ